MAIFTVIILIELNLNYHNYIFFFIKENLTFDNNVQRKARLHQYNIEEAEYSFILIVV
jgi:hypothetical protein